MQNSTNYKDTLIASYQNQPTIKLSHLTIIILFLFSHTMTHL